MAKGAKNITEIPAGCPCRIEEVWGEERLRFFDLGFYPGSRVLPMYECAGGGTRVYLVKNTLIALRNGDGKKILAKEDEENGAGVENCFGGESQHGEEHSF